MPEIGLALGYEQGEHIAWVREWLYWYDQSGNRYLTAEERARAAAAIAAQAGLLAQQERLLAQQERLAKEAAEAIAAQAGLLAQQERLAKEEAEQKAQRLAARLRSLGINPDER